MALWCRGDCISIASLWGKSWLFWNNDFYNTFVKLIKLVQRQLELGLQIR